MLALNLALVTLLGVVAAVGHPPFHRFVGVNNANQGGAFGQNIPFGGQTPGFGMNRGQQGGMFGQQGGPGGPGFGPHQGHFGGQGPQAGGFGGQQQQGGFAPF